MNRPTSSPIAYLNGRRIPASELAIAPTDAGFVWGATLAERIRTFRGELFELDRHLQRLQHGMELMGWSGLIDAADLARQASDVARCHYELIDPRADVTVIIFVTPGVLAGTAIGQRPVELTVGVHSQPLRFELWRDEYRRGHRLVVTPHRQVAPSNWPTALKCRSRMHFYLAEQAAARIDPLATALLLDHDGHVAETSSANVIGLAAPGHLISPPLDVSLPGISLEVVRQLAVERGWHFEQRTVPLAELEACSEVWLASTPYCLLPVVSIDTQPIGAGVPGPAFTELIAAWSRRVGVDIVQQAFAGATSGGAADQTGLARS